MINNSKKKTSKPKDASSVIIINKKKNDLYVLMGRRPAKSRFMPSIYVFPGGAVDKTDYKVNKIFKLSTDLKRTLLKSRSQAHTIAIMLAGIRETAEECGLFLTRKTKFLDCKDLACDNMWDLFLKKSLLPSIQNLHYFGRAITPAYLKTRFHARFFISDFKDFSGEIKANGELENLEWIKLSKARLLPLADVTEFLINRLIEFKNKSSRFQEIGVYPMFTRRNKKMWVKWDQ